MRAVELLVLDAHGVVFNSPFRGFLRDLAVETGQTPEHLLARWHADLRVPAWTGKLSDAAIWDGIAGDRFVSSQRTSEWRQMLERRYELGPAGAHLDRWFGRVPIWLLTNHRSHWLLPRLHRFGLARYFDRVLVSDELGAVKPSPRVFAPLVRVADPDAILFVDDQVKNVRVARDLGLQALHATDGDVLGRAVERRIAPLDTAAPQRA